MSASDSFMMSHPGPSDDETELDSLPSISTSEFSSEAGDDSDAQREWEASLEQIQLLLTMVVIPFAGKYFGRKFAYWSWARYMEWTHDVEVMWTNKKKFQTAGAAQAVSAL